MQFDLAKLDILTASEQGRDLILVHPTTGQPFRRADGAPLMITLRGRSSAIARATQRAINDERAAIDADGRQPTREQFEEWDIRFLADITVGWGWDKLGEEDFPFNAENARRFWSDKRFMWLRPRAFSFCNEDGNFLAA